MGNFKNRKIEGVSMENTKKKHDTGTKPKQKKEHWFSLKGIIDNFKKIRWLPLRSRRDGTDGLLVKFTKVVLFMLVFAVIFIAIDALFSYGIVHTGFMGGN